MTFSEKLSVIKDYSNLAIVILGIAGFGLYGWLALKPVKVLDVVLPVKIDKPVYQRGDFISYTYEYKKYVDSKPEINHELECTGHMRISDNDVQKVTRLSLPDVSLYTPPGGGKLTKTLPLPAGQGAPYGKCRILERISYPVNILRTETYDVYTEWFTVKP